MAPTSSSASNSDSASSLPLQETKPARRKNAKHGKRSGKMNGKNSVELAQASGLHPVQVRWENLTYRVPKPATQQQANARGTGPFSVCGKKSALADEEANGVKNADDNMMKILDKLSGTVNPGEMLAIMGTSGAGKTSLLNVLSSRVADADIQGQILLNGVPQADADALLAHQTYIMQDDVLMGSQTPREVLRFSARLRLPHGTTKEQAEERVNAILKELNLVDCADSPIGTVGAKRGISGGERKRTAIGIELVTNPSLLFVDEPTTGLDSHTAERCVGTLKMLAHAGRTVIATIHQPSSKIFEQFDKVLLLAKGRTVFFGPRKELYQYFSSIGKPVPANTNPADFLLDIGWVDETEPESLQALKKLASAFAESEFKKQFTNQEPVVKESKIAARIGTYENVSSTDFQTSFWIQLRELTARHFRDMWREPMKIRAPIGQTLFMALLIGFIYFQIGNGQATAQDRLGSLFFILINQTMTGAFGTVTSFMTVKALFMREHSNKMYRTTAYYASRILGDLPLQLVSFFLFSTLSFWLIGFAQHKNASGALSMFLMYLVLNLLMVRVATGMGLFIGILAPAPDVAMAITPLTMIPLMMFSGFYVNSENIPAYFSWVEAISPMRYAFEGLAATVMDGVKFTCKPDQRVGSGCPADLSEDAPADLPNCVCRIQTGEQVVDNFNFSDDNTGWNITVLISMMVLFIILGHWALLWVAQKSSSA